MDLNKVQIIGRLTRDPEARTTQTGRNVTSFAVATSRQWKDQSGAKQEQTEYHDVVAWGKLAEICAEYLGKGRQVYVEGRLQTRSWEGQDGQKKYRTEVIADNMIMLGGGQGGPASSAGAKPVAVPAAGASAKPDAAAKPAAPAEDEISIEDIPF